MALIAACIAQPAIGDKTGGKGAENQQQGKGGNAALPNNWQTWPAHGTAGVPTNLALIGLRFETPVSGLDSGGQLLGENGSITALAARAVDCVELGWANGFCIQLTPAGSLAADTSYRLQITSQVLDPQQTPLSLTPVDFRTGPGPQTSAPHFLMPPCLVDEAVVPPACVIAEDHRLTVQLRSSQPQRLWLIADHTTAVQITSRGEAALALNDLSANTAVTASLRGVDLAGNEQLSVLQMTTAPELATLSITEVRADPRGPEPAQEFVEVLNFGNLELSLKGFAVCTGADGRCVRINDGQPVPPGGRILLVSDAFDPDNTEDDRVPQGVPLLRVGSSLNSGGLSNQGEALYLRDDFGRRLSASPSRPEPRQGVCVVRRLPELRRGQPSDFGYDAAQACTPGLADRFSDGS